MASAIDIAVNSRNYVGNAGIGGGSFGSFQLDTKPVEDLARYVMLYNKSEYDQRQKDAEKAAAEIADYTSYDLTSGIPKDAKLLQEKYEKLTNYVRDNPGAIDYRNKEQWAEYKKMRNELDNDLNGAKVRNAMWALRQKEIQEQPNQDLKKVMQGELDAEIEATNIRTPLKYTQQYQDNSPKLPDAPELTFDVTKVGPNSVVEREYSLFNVPRARANGDMFALGVNKDIDPNSPQGQRDIINNKNNFWLQGAEAFNSVLNAQNANGDYLYKTKTVDADGKVTYTVDEQKLSRLPKNILSLVKETNKYLSDTKADINSGLLLDKFERPLTFGPGALNEADYDEINYEDGISPEELAVIAQYAKWKGDTYKTDVKQTDNAIQLRGQDIQDRHNKATEAIAWGNLGLEREKFNDATDKWKTAMRGGETVKNGAMEFAKRLYSDMGKLTDKNGVISPDKVRQLNQEQLKYLGGQITSENTNTGVISVTYAPLAIPEGAAIQLVNGEVKVLLDAKQIPDGRYTGTYDPTKSSNIFNIGTNRLNEQLKNAGAKELNSYLPIDLGVGGISTNTTGGSTTTSAATVIPGGSTTNKVSTWDKYKVNK